MSDQPWRRPPEDGSTGSGRPESPDRPGAVDPERDTRALRAVLGTFATGVTVVTVGGPAPHGMTANSFTSVSLDPPLVLVCISRDSVMHGRVAAAGCFAISVLDAGQEHLARHFADRNRRPGRAQFDPVGWETGALTGAPLIGGALAWLECRLWRRYDGGDHSIFVGRLLSARTAQDTAALVFHGGRFRRLAGTAVAVAATRTGVADHPVSEERP